MNDAQQDFNRLAGELRAEHVEDASPNMRIRVTPLQDDVVKHAAGLLMLFGAAGVVLLIGCTNIAHLLLARGTMRRRELAVRAALGATKARLERQRLIEIALLRRRAVAWPERGGCLETQTARNWKASPLSDAGRLGGSSARWARRWSQVVASTSARAATNAR